jgi:hypothetical protein
MLQRIAALALHDMAALEAGTLDMTSVKSLASLGSSGAYPNNIWRDLKRKLPVPKLPAPELFNLPMQHNVLGHHTIIYEQLDNSFCRRECL